MVQLRKGVSATLLDSATHSNSVVFRGLRVAGSFGEDFLGSPLHLGSMALHRTVAQISQQLAFLPTSRKGGRAESERGHRCWKTKVKLLQRVFYAIAMAVL